MPTGRASHKPQTGPRPSCRNSSSQMKTYLKPGAVHGGSGGIAKCGDIPLSASAEQASESRRIDTPPEQPHGGRDGGWTGVRMGKASWTSTTTAHMCSALVHPRIKISGGLRLLLWRETWPTMPRNRTSRLSSSACVPSRRRGRHRRSPAACSSSAAPPARRSARPRRPGTRRPRRRRRTARRPRPPPAPRPEPPAEGRRRRRRMRRARGNAARAPPPHARRSARRAVRETPRAVCGGATPPPRRPRACDRRRRRRVGARCDGGP